MKIGIVSLGLIGTSLLKSLSDKGYEIFCVTRNEESVKKAKAYCKESSKDISILNVCDVVFVCSPISNTLEMLDKLESVVTKECIVLDCASVKEFVMQKERPYKFIGSHPMAGTEKNGFDAGYKELFEGAKWVICPARNVERKDIEKIEDVIKNTGAIPITATAKEHDTAVALISHAPMYVSQAIFDSVKDNELAKKLASSGFRDMTRLAMSNTKMAEDMLEYNGENISKALGMLGTSMENLQNDYSAKIKKIASDREKMYSKDGKNIF